MFNHLRKHAVAGGTWTITVTQCQRTPSPLSVVSCTRRSENKRIFFIAIVLFFTLQWCSGARDLITCGCIIIMHCTIYAFRLRGLTLLHHNEFNGAVAPCPAVELNLHYSTYESQIWWRRCHWGLLLLWFSHNFCQHFSAITPLHQR